MSPGAICELELNRREAEWLTERLAAQSSICRSRKLMRFYLVAYLGYQIGYCSMAVESLTDLPEEAQRFAKRCDYYSSLLHRIATRSASYAEAE